jgi:hypothetical protein
MRVRYLTALCTTTLLLLGVSPSANANERPDCPCWGGGEIGLAGIIMGFELIECHPHAQHNADGGFASITATGVPTPTINALASVPNFKPDSISPSCRITDWDPEYDVFLQAVNAPNVHKCIRDITAVCRALGF